MIPPLKIFLDANILFSAAKTDGVRDGSGFLPAYSCRTARRSAIRA